MVDSERDHPTIVEVLAAFLREHATTPTSATSAAAWPLAVGAVAKQENIQSAPMPPMPADTAAAARVIARRPSGRAERGRLDLHCCYLRGANLTGADLSGANLFGANLSGFRSYANLSRANLSEAYLIGANLFRVNLFRANLFRANLSGVRNLTREQLLEAESTEGATLPDYLKDAN